MTALTLPERILLAQSAHQRLDSLMGDLARAQASGNLERIRGVALAAENLAMELDERLSEVRQEIDRLSDEAFEADYEARFGRVA